MSAVCEQAIARYKRHFQLPLIIPPEQPIELISGPTPQARWVTVSVLQATHWLGELNVQNRPLRTAHILRLATDMRNGDWKGRNGEAIKFDTNNKMIEGQHRCWACVECGLPFETLLITGVEPGIENTSGTGATRVFADFMNEKNRKLLCAALKLMYVWGEGRLAQAFKLAAPSNAVMQKVLDQYPDIRESVHWIAGHSVRRVLTPRYGVLIHYAGTLEGRSATVESFLDRLGTGLGYTDTDPIYHLHNFLISNRKKGIGSKSTDQDYVLQMVIKAWNASKEGRSMKKLAIRSDEALPQL